MVVSEFRSRVNGSPVERGKNWILTRSTLGFLDLKFHSRFFLDVKDIHAIRKAILSLTDGIPCPIYMDATGFEHATRLASELGIFGLDHQQEWQLGIYCSNTLLSTLIQTTFLRYQNKHLPIKLFTSPMQADSWMCLGMCA